MWLALGVKVKNGENQFLEPLYSLQVSENGRCGCLWLVAPNIVLFVKQFNSSVGILIKIEMHSCLKWPLSRLPYFGEIYSSPSDKLQSMKARRGGGGAKNCLLSLVVLQTCAGIYRCLLFTYLSVLCKHWQHQT